MGMRRERERIVTTPPSTGSALRERTVSFTARDGFACNLINVQGARPPERGPVLLVHGAGVRANIFRAPTRVPIVEYLIAAGYDVWLENWRASIDLPPNLWTLDQAALFDHPAAVQTVVRESGHDTVKAIIHCQGSTSFMMSATAGLLPEVTTIVANAVSLHPVVPPWSRFKLDYAIPLLQRITPYLNPQWGDNAPTLLAKLVRLFVDSTHHECANHVCRQVSVTYGSGFPALWSHKNLSDQTHDWLRREFAHVPLTFFMQIAECVRRGRLVAVDGYSGLPADFTAQPAATDARIAFFAGANNLCFLPESQRRSFEWFDAQRPGYHSLHILPGYGHLDVFMGSNAAQDTFPLIVAELDRP
jgi:hypothetical protein